MLWHRRPGESEKAYAAFELYRELGPKRSQSAVALEMKSSEKVCSQWSVKWHWVSRVAEFDRYYEAKKAELVHEKRMQALSRQAELGARMQEKAGSGLDHLDETCLSAGEIANLAKEGVKIERLAMGDSTANVESRGIQLVFHGAMPPWAPEQTDPDKSAIHHRSVPASEHLLPDSDAPVVIDAD